MCIRDNIYCRGGSLSAHQHPTVNLSEHLLSGRVT
ncbi:hypothetical protein T4A_11533, partial [Trichinella pseudospiralis]